MNPRVLLVTCLVTVLACLTPGTAAAQWSAGGGLVYGTDVNTVGIDLRGYYELDIPDLLIIAVPDLNFFFPVEQSGNDITLITFDALGHWIFESADEWEIYAISGLGLSFQTITFVRAIGGESSNTNVNINFDLGLGVEHGMDFGGIFGEIRFVISKANQLVIGGGVRFEL